MISLANGVFSEAIPASILWSLILGRNINLRRTNEDNQAIITVVEGFSKKLRHISRTHNVNLSSLKEACLNDDTELTYIDTKKQAADIFTYDLAPNLGQCLVHARKSEELPLPSPRWGGPQGQLGTLWTISLSLIAEYSMLHLFSSIYLHFSFACMSLCHLP